MAEEIPDNETAAGLVSAPIIPSLPEIQSGSDPLALLNTPPPIITPPIPSGKPVSFDINNQLQGDFNTGPLPGARKVNPQTGNGGQGGTLDFVKATVDYMHDDETVRDRYKYGRTYSYGSGYKNMNFERFYNHAGYKKLGFSPYRDNESLYNERTSWWDDFNRMTGEWGKLLWTGAKSVWGDEQAANESMEKSMAIGSSSREGMGGWVTNFGINSAYTVGIIGEMALEDLALGAIEAASWGTASPLVAGRLAAQGSRLYQLTKAIKGTGEFIRGLRNAEKVKDVFNAARAGEKLKDVAHFLNPLQRTVDWSTHLVNGTNGVKHLSNLAKTTRTFGNFYRDLRDINLAHSEARLEGEGASAQYHEKILDEFYQENGRLPEPDEAKEIFDRAQSVKAATTLANDMVIYYTNRLTFDGMFEGAGTGLYKVMDGIGSRFLKKTAAKDFQVGTKAAFGAGEQATGFAAKAKNFLLKSQYVPWSRTYLLGNFSEGLQESSQEIIAKSAQDYYDRIHSDPAQAGFYSAMQSIGKGTGDQFNAQGLDVFLQGYLMGSLIQGVGGVYKAGKQKLFTSKAERDAAKTAEEEAQNKSINSLNFLIDNALIYGGNKSDVVSSINALHEAKRNAKANGDVMTAKNMETEANVNHYHELARNNSMKLLTSYIDDLNTLEDSELENAFNNAESASKIREKLATFKDRALGYQAKYNEYDRLRPNQFNPQMYAGRNKDGSLKYPEQYQEELNSYNAHEAIKADVLFATEAYEQMADRLASMGNNLMGNGPMGNMFNVTNIGNPVANALGSDLSILADVNMRKAMIVDMKGRISVLEQGTKEQKREAKVLGAQLRFLQEWAIVADAHVTELESERRATFSPIEQNARRFRTNFRVGSTVRDKDTGEILTVSKHIVGTRTDKKYYRQPGTILKKADGTTVKFDPNKHVKEGDPVGAIPSKFAGVEGDGVTQTLEELYKIYEKYVKFVSGIKGGFVFNDQMQEAFVQIKDFIHLKQEQRRMVTFINAMSDPTMYEKYFNVQKGIQGTQRALKAANIQKALNTFKKRAGKNKMLQEIFDLGLYVLPEDIDMLEDFEIRKFYNVAGSSLLSETDPKFQQAVEILTKYANKEGKEVKLPVKKEEVVQPQTAEGEAAVKAEEAVVEEEEKEPEGTFAVEPTTSVSTIKEKHPKLYNKLLAGYKAWYNDQYDKDVTLSDDQIADSQEFDDYIKTSGSAVNIISTYNDVEQLKPAPKKAKAAAPAKKTPVVSEPPETKKALTEAQWIALIKKAVSERELDAIDDQITKADAMTPEIVTEMSKKRDTFKKPEEAAVSDIETEKQKITPAEFKEVVRLAKFFLENPKEPTVAGSVVVRYPELFKEVTNIEKRRKEAISNFYTTEAQKIASEFIPQALKDINTKYDAEIDALTKEETKTGEQLELFEEMPEGRPITISEGTITITTSSTDTYSEYYTFKVENGKVVSGKRNTSFLGEYRDTRTENTIENPEAEYNRLSNTYSEDNIDVEGKPLEEAPKSHPILEQYNNIKTAEDLANWEQAVNELLSLPQSKERTAFENAIGVPFTSKYVDKAKKDKKKELRESLNFADLKPGTRVKMANGRTVKVVKSNDGNTLTLVTPLDYKKNNPDAKAVTVSKEELKDKVMMKENDFADSAEITPEPTEEQVATSKEEIEAAKAMTDGAKIKNKIDELKIADAAKVREEAANKFKSCKL